MIQRLASNKITQMVINGVTFGVPVLALFQLGWQFGFKHLIPLPFYFSFNNFMVRALLVGYLLFFPLILLFKSKNPFALILIIAAIPMCGWAAIIWGEEYDLVLESGQLEEHNYHLVMHGIFSTPWSLLALYKCDQRSLHCEEIFTKETGNQPIDLIIDKNLKEVYVLHFGALIYSHGETIREYEFEESFSTDTFVYDIYRNDIEDEAKREFRLLRCGATDEDYFNCEIMSFHYATTKPDTTVVIEFDEDAQTLNLLIGGDLVYTYDGEGQCHAEGCSIPGQQ